LKISNLAKAIAHAKALDNRQFGSKIKNAKNICQKPFYNKIRVVLCQTPPKKTPNN